MKIVDERELLPFINHQWQRKPAKELSILLTYFGRFLESGQDEDTYNGYVYDLRFLKCSSKNYTAVSSGISQDNTLDLGGCILYGGLEKDESYIVIAQKGLIKIHMHSFLFYNNFGV